MATELAKAYVQIVPSAEGITGSITKVLGGEAVSAGKSAGTSISKSMAGAITAGIAALGIGKIISESITSGSAYQTSISKLGTIADTSAMSMGDMKAQIYEISNAMGISQKNLAEGAYSVISATGDTAGALDIVQQSAKLATAGFTDTDSAVSVLTTSLNAYGLEAAAVEHISDSLVTTQNLGVTTVAELASNMGRAIATASGYGVSLENLESAYISTTKSGISTAESTTYLSSMMAELGKDGSGVSTILKDETGKSFGELMASGKSLGDVLGVLMDSVDGNSEAFMNLWGSQEAGKAANAIVNQGLDTFNENLKTLETQAGTTETAYNQMTDTFEWKTQNLKTNIENLGVALFEAIYPVLEELVEKAMEFVKNMDVDAIAGEISGFVSNVVPLVSTLAEAISFVGEHLNVIVPVIGALMGFSIASKVLGVVTAVMSLFSGISALAPVIAALTGPIGIVIAVVAGLVAGIITLWNTNEGFRNTVIGIWEGIKSAVSSAIEAVKGFFADLMQKAGEIGASISSAYESVKDTLVSVWDTITSAVTGAWDTIVSAISSAWETIQSVIEVGVLLIQEIISAAVEILMLPWNFIWENFGTVITDAWEGFKTTISEAMNTISTTISDIWNAIVGFITPILTTIGTTVSTVWSGIQSVTSSVFSAVSGFLSSIWSSISSAISTAVNAIRTVVSSVWNAIRSVITSVMSSIRSTVSSVWNGIRSTVSSVVNGIKSVISSGFNAAKSTVTSIFNSIRSTISSVMNGAASVVSSAISRIKGLFNFSWSLPPLKLPHFSISGSFSLNPPSVPHLSIDWYRKAMDTPYMFSSPTIFGINGDGQPMGAGEAGDEVMIGKNTMLGMMRTAVAAETNQGGLATELNQIRTLLNRYLPAAGNGTVVLDSGEVVGIMTPAIDRQLGKISTYRERRN